MNNSAIKRICVYCGSSDKMDPGYLRAAEEMGAAIAAEGIGLVYGAGRIGLMGAVADGVLQAGGEVTGVIPHYFNTPQLAHRGLTKLEVVDTIHQRKARMAELADAFIALPGGFGTFEELFEILTWSQIGLHTKPVGILNVKNYFDPLLLLIEHALREGFIYAEHRALFVHAGQAGDLLGAMAKLALPSGPNRWVSREEG